MGHLVVTGDDEPTDLSDGTVGRMDALSPSHFDFTWWDPVVLTAGGEAPGLALAGCARVGALRPGG